MSIGEILILPDFKPSVKSVMLIEVTAPAAPCWQMSPDEDSELFLSRVFSLIFYQKGRMVQANRKQKM